MQLTFATQPSALARRQTLRVIQLLQAAQPALRCIQSVITTADDREPDLPLHENGEKRLITREIEDALLSGRVQAAVHSLKDLPVDETPGLVIAAIPQRGPVYDVLISRDGRTLASLPEGAQVGTYGLRRTAQLLAQRPDLTIMPVQGSVDLRVQRLIDGEYDAIVLAQAGLTYLGLQGYITEVFPLDVILPAPGQGALAVQCRAEDIETLALLATLHDPLTAAAVAAERAFLRSLGGRDSLPIAAFAERIDGAVILTGAVLSPDGRQAIRLTAVDTDPQKLGERLAGFVLERGGVELLMENAIEP
jgi:hydroxymethylbilane synthase